MDSIKQSHQKSKMTKRPVRRQLDFTLSKADKRAANSNSVEKGSTKDDADAETPENTFSRRILLLNSIYHLNSEKFVKIGLDLDNKFQRTVEIGKNVTKIPYLYLTAVEWELLFINEEVITDFFKSKNPEMYPYLITELFTINFSILYEKRCIRITNRKIAPAGSIYLTRSTWKSLKNLEPCISYALENLCEKVSIAESAYNTIFNAAYSVYGEELNVSKDQFHSKCIELYTQHYGPDTSNPNNFEKMCASEIVSFCTEKIFDKLKNDEEDIENIFMPNFYNDVD